MAKSTTTIAQMNKMNKLACLAVPASLESRTQAVIAITLRAASVMVPP